MPSWIFLNRKATSYAVGKNLSKKAFFDKRVLERMYQIDHFLRCRKKSRSKKEFSAVGVWRSTDGKTGLLKFKFVGRRQAPCCCTTTPQLAHTPDHSRHTHTHRCSYRGRQCVYSPRDEYVGRDDYTATPQHRQGFTLLRCAYGYGGAQQVLRCACATFNHDVF